MVLCDYYMKNTVLDLLTKNVWSRYLSAFHLEQISAYFYLYILDSVTCSI